MPKYKLIQINTTEDIQFYKEIILGIWERNLPKLSKDCFDWVYKNSPYGPAKTVLAQCVATGEYVGCAGIYPKILNVGGKQIKAGVLINFAVDQKHRVFGPAMLIQKEILNAYLSKDFDLILGYPNKSSEGVFRRLGYSFIGEGDYWSKVLEWRSKIRSVIKVKIAVDVLGTGLNFFCRLFEIFNKIKIGSRDTVRILSELPQNFDSLRAISQKNHYVIGITNTEYLRWRYQGAKNASFKFFSLYNKEKELCAYIVYIQEAGTVTIFDLFAVDFEKSKYILALFVDRMRQFKNKSITMVYVGDGSIKRVLKQLGFLRRKDKRSLLVSCGNVFTEQEKANLLLLRNWHMSDGELDL